MWALSEENIHRHFAGYLGIKRTCEVEDTRDRVFFDYDGFFNAFFKVRDDNAPYILPFDTSEIDERSDFWFNENVAGSYSTSSIRDDKPFAQVVDYGGSYSDRWWTLVDDHLDIARREMLEAKGTSLSKLKNPLQSMTSLRYSEKNSDLRTMMNLTSCSETSI